MNILLAGLLMIIASLLMAGHDAITKYLTSVVVITSILWFRYFTQAIILLVLFVVKKNIFYYKSNKSGLQILRAVSLLGLSVFSIIGFKYLPLAQVVSVIFCAPILVAVLSYFLFKEKNSLIYWIYLIIGFGGVLLMVRPEKSSLSLYFIFPFLAALSFAFHQVINKKLSLQDSVFTSNLITSLICLTLLTPFFLINYERVNSINYIYLFSLGVFATLGHLLMTISFKFAPASIMAPITYTQIIFVGIISYFLFSYNFENLDYFGLGLIVVSGMLIFFNNYRQFIKKE